MSDDSILTGLGHNTSGITEGIDQSLLYFPEPQAASTAGNKKTRMDLARQYLNTIDGGIIQGNAPSPLLNLIGKLKSVPSAMVSEGATSIDKQSQDSGTLGNLSLINVENMSGLSSSMLLVDHNIFSDQKESAPLRRKLPSYEVDFHTDEGRENPVPTLTQQELQDLETDYAEGEQSDLSQGEDEEIMAEVSMSTVTRDNLKAFYFLSLVQKAI